MPLRFAFHSITHKGMVRPDNQDNVYAGKLSRTAERYLFAVADGVGGREGGAWASNRTLQVLVQEMSQPSISMPTAVQSANQAVFQEAARDSTRNGAATTLTAVLVENDSFTWANVGDSRAYLLRGEDCYQITRDHSLVEEDLAAGRITREEAENSNYRNVITRSIGHRPGVEVDCEGPFEMEPGDVLLLCSDGLHQLVSVDEIKRELLQGTAESAATTLLDLANSRGGPDNISVVICAVGPGTETRFRRGGKDSRGATQATRFIPREQAAPVAAALAPIAPMPEAVAVPEPEAEEPVLELEPIEAMPEEPEPAELQAVVEAPPAEQAVELATRPRPLAPDSSRAEVAKSEPEPVIESAPAPEAQTSRRIARLEPVPLDGEVAGEPSRPASREPALATDAAPVRRESAPRAARQAAIDDAPKENSGPGIRLIGFGIAVGATVGILIGLLRPF